MKQSRLIMSSFVVAAVLFVAPALAEMRLWVAIDDLKRHTCPSPECGVVGQFFFGESVYVFEAVNGWSRVSRFKPAACYEGVSIYVEAGPSACSEDNGIEEGRFAEWVRSEFLVESRPDRRQDTHG